MSDAAVSESVSKKRGRPRVLVEPAEAAFRKLFLEVRSRRSLQNRAYWGHTSTALKEVPDYLACFRWLLGECGDTGATWRMGVLTELGRTRHPETIVHLADQLCGVAAKRRLTTTEAVALVRQWRGKAAGRDLCKPSQDGLVNALCATLDHYRRAHPDTGKADMLEALNEVYGVVGEMMESEGRKVL
jgi:hypothetical protein